MSRAQDLGETGHVFSNWASTYSCRPELYFEPSTRDELRQILEAARTEGKRVRVVGNGCSPSDLVCTPDYMISMRRFDKILQIDKEKRTVVVESGVMVTEINETLANNDLALSVLGSISYNTLVGAVSTGVHGTGINYGILSTYLKEVTLMTADGDVITVSRDTDETTYLAACLSLGALGVILSVKVQCEPAFHLEQIRYGARREKVMEELDALVARSDHFRFHWFPLTDDCVIFENTRTKKPIRRATSWFWDVAVSYHLVQFLFWLSTFLPILLPAITWVCYNVLERQRREIVDRSDRLFNFDCLFKQYVMEWAFPWEKTAVVLEDMKRWFDESGYKAHSPIEVRFTKADDVFLSPCYGQDSCYINILCFRPYGKEVPHESFWTAFQEIVLNAGGRPHWAKDHTLTRDQFVSMYPRWNEFCSVRQRLDPTGMFINSNLERVFGRSANDPNSGN